MPSTTGTCTSSASARAPQLTEEDARRGAQARRHRLLLHRHQPGGPRRRGRRGVPVFNAPYSNTRSVAELVLAEIIMLLRGHPGRRSARVHRGGWTKSGRGQHVEVRGKTLGIVGYGHIGTQLGVLAEAWACASSSTTSPQAAARQRARPCASSTSCWRRERRRHPARARDAADEGDDRCAPSSPDEAGAHLINAARGTVVDIDALAAALERGHLGGAAIDVFPVEPKGNDEPVCLAAAAFDNVILTPHIGGSTVEAQANIGPRSPPSSSATATTARP
jgi:D-3-phosphoglycerate dehydrogenase